LQHLKDVLKEREGREEAETQLVAEIEAKEGALQALQLAGQEEQCCTGD